MAESSSTLGRKWLDTILYYHSLRLTDFEVSTAIHRTLSTSPLTTCPWCSKSNSLGHDEVCLARPRQTVARHDSVARILHSTLKTIDPTAEHEPTPPSKAGGTMSGSEGLSRRLWTSMSRFTPSLAIRLPKRQPIQPLALLYLSTSYSKPQNTPSR